MRPLAIAAAVMLSIAACGSDDDPLAPPLAVASIVVTPGTPSLYVGQTLTLFAVPRGADGEPLPERPVTWASQTPALATVSAAGVVQALAAGNAVIRVSSEGVELDVPVGIALVPAAAIVLHPGTAALREGQQRQMTAVLLDAQGDPLDDGREIAWRSTNTAVATVDADGTVHAVTEGTAQIVATHGPLEASTPLAVGVEWVAEFLFEAHDGTSTLPYLFASDPRTPLVAPSYVTPFAGTRHAAPSPDGTRIAFTCDVGICVADRDGTDIDILTDGDRSYEDSPTWSPDGARIAFRRWAQGGSAELVEQTDIWVMNADGTAQVNITDDATSQGDPAWSPVRADGGTRIAYRELAMVDGYVTNRLFTMRPDGTDRRGETAAGLLNASEPSWTPDGQRLVYVQDGGEVSADLWIVTVGQSDAAPLMATAIPGEQRGPTVSPDGRLVLFTSMHDGVPGVGFRRQLYTVRLDGTGLMRRTSDALDKEHPAWRVYP